MVDNRLWQVDRVERHKRYGRSFLFDAKLRLGIGPEARMGITIKSRVDIAPAPPLHMSGAVNHSRSLHTLANSHSGVCACLNRKFQFRSWLGHPMLLLPSTQRIRRFSNRASRTMDSE